MLLAVPFVLADGELLHECKLISWDMEILEGLSTFKIVISLGDDSNPGFIHGKQYAFKSEPPGFWYTGSGRLERIFNNEYGLCFELSSTDVCVCSTEFYAAPSVDA